MMDTDRRDRYIHFMYACMLLLLVTALLQARSKRPLTTGEGSTSGCSCWMLRD